ncbi:hypothetical protein N7G274_002746 [Stereocaulon virgatum]|uniref:LAGLIDADG homing endonuclease n=1 Tax=Stereocaulon virgatum TaxID=373712 RepID=A0ABR4AJI5_9LECA
MTRNRPSSNYFDRFPGFLPDPQLPLHEEFERLAKFRGWHTGSKQYRRENGRFLRAEFDVHLGGLESSRKLDDWQALCEELRVDSIPNSITKCKKKLNKVHVNLVDLINCRRQHTEVRIFKTHKALVTYTRATDKIFPKTKAKADGLLQILLRKIY